MATAGRGTDELQAIVCVMGVCCYTRGSGLAYLIFNSPPGAQQGLC